MKTAITIFFFGIICLQGLSAMETALGDYDFRREMQKFELTDFGKYMMDLLQVESMASGASIDNIKALITKMRSKLAKDQKFATEQWGLAKESCDSLITAANKQIPLYQQAIEEAKKIKNNAETTKRDSKIRRKQIRKDIESVTQRQESSKKLREEEIKNENAKLTEIEEAIAAIKIAIRMLKKRRRYRPEEYVQLDQQITKAFTSGVGFSLSTEIHVMNAEVVASRRNLDTTMFVEYDEEKAKMIKLLNQLLELFQKAHEEALKEQKDNKAKYEQLIIDLAAQQKTLSEELSQMNSRIKKANEEINATSKTIQTTSELLASTQRSLVDTTKTCNKQEADFKKDEADRNGEISVLDKMLDIIQKRGAAVKEYAATR